MWQSRGAGRRIHLERRDARTKPVREENREMSHATESFTEMLMRFGGSLGLRKIDVDQLIETHRKNIDALAQSATVLSEGATAVAEKRREILESGMREVLALARDFKPLATGPEAVAKQTEFAKKAFDLTGRQSTRDVAVLANQSTSEAIRIFRDRIESALEEIKSAVDGAGPSASVKE